MGQYDQTLKSLVDTNPEAMAHFVLHMWQKQQGATVLDTPIMAATLLNSEFQSEELRGDSILLLEGADGPLYVVEIEFQSTLDDTMPLRSLEYLARTKKKHMIASWFLEGKDSDWLEEEFQKMYEIFGDAPAIQWIKDKAREEERKRIEAERQAERKRNETQWKKAALEIISIRAPKLKRLAKTQIATITNYEELEQLIVQLSLADGIYEIEDILCSLHEQKIQEGDEQ